ncbi:MAG: threonine aldolase family protein [Propioniciclava sp.]
MLVDLRSDTITRPTEAMRQAMLAAPVGDDVFGEDPSVAELEAEVADLFGHEAGLFCASGSLANVLGVATQVSPGQEVLCDARAHIARAEMGAHGALTGVTMRTWVTPDGLTRPDDVADLVVADGGPYLVSTACVAVENTHNFGGGTIQPLEVLAEVSRRVRSVGVGLHLDGARLWNAQVETKVPMVDYGRLFDTVSVCFSKGLGAPVGSVLVGSADAVRRARILRKRLGAGWRQAGLLAAACSYALHHHVERLAEDHVAARAFADALGSRLGEELTPPQTNIVVVDTGGRPAAAVAAEAAATGVLLTPVGPHTLRAVTHLEVDVAGAAHAGAVLGEILG